MRARNRKRINDDEGETEVKGRARQRKSVKEDVMVIPLEQLSKEHRSSSHRHHHHHHYNSGGSASSRHSSFSSSHRSHSSSRSHRSQSTSSRLRVSFPDEEEIERKSNTFLEYTPPKRDVLTSINTKDIDKPDEAYSFQRYASNKAKEFSRQRNRQRSKMPEKSEPKPRVHIVEESIPHGARKYSSGKAIIKKSSSPSNDDFFFDLVNFGRKKSENEYMLKQPSEMSFSSTQFDTMTGEEFDDPAVISRSIQPETLEDEQGSPSKSFTIPVRASDEKYDYELYFAAKFAAMSRNVTIDDYVAQYSVITENAKEASELKRSITATVQQAVSMRRSRSSRLDTRSEWRSFRDTILNNGFDELIALTKQYVKKTPHHLTRFFQTPTSPNSTPTQNLNDASKLRENGYENEESDPKVVPSVLFNDINLSGVRNVAIGDRCHVFAFHALRVAPTTILTRIRVAASSVPIGRAEELAECVFGYLGAWISDFPNDFDEGTYRTATDALRAVSAAAPAGRFLLYFIRAVMRGIAKRLISIERLHSFPLRKDLDSQSKSTLESSLFGLSKSQILYRVPPLMLAEAFMYVEASDVAHLTVGDVLAQRFAGIVGGFNSTADFISRSILIEGVKDRSKRLTFWIDLMVAAAECGNLFLVFEISAALAHPAIARLRRTWDALQASTRDAFYAVDELSNPAGRYATMRAFIQSRPRKDTLPFVLAVAREAEQVRMLAPDVSNRAVNIAKLHALAGIASDACGWSLKTFNVDPRVEASVRKVKEFRPSPRDPSLSELSRRIEPPPPIPTVRK